MDASEAPPGPGAADVAEALRVSLGLLYRQLKQVPSHGELTLPESAVLARLERGGPTTATALARREQISAQSVGATIAGLEARGLVERSADPDDGRRSLVSLTDAGLKALRNRRDQRSRRIAAALDADFSPSELRQIAAAAPLIERLAQQI
jgi:DNA-binding MarR family transcriptional regulator